MLGLEFLTGALDLGPGLDPAWSWAQGNIGRGQGFEDQADRLGLCKSTIGTRPGVSLNMVPHPLSRGREILLVKLLRLYAQGNVEY